MYARWGWFQPQFYLQHQENPPWEETMSIMSVGEPSDVAPKVESISLFILERSSFNVKSVEKASAEN